MPTFFIISIYAYESCIDLVYLKMIIDRIVEWLIFRTRIEHASVMQYFIDINKRCPKVQYPEGHVFKFRIRIQYVNRRRNNTANEK